MNLQNRWRWTIFLAGCVMIGLFVFRFGLPFLADFLEIDMPVQSADVAIVLGGGGGERVRAAVDLYKQGHAPYLMMSGGPRFHHSEAHYMKEYAVHLGVPREHILLETLANSTHTNAELTLDIMENLNMTSALVVTSGFHTRRAYTLFRSIWPYPLNQLTVVAADDGINHNQWWYHYEMAQTVLIEWGKLIVMVLVQPLK